MTGTGAKRHLVGAVLRMPVWVKTKPLCTGQPAWPQKWI